MRHLKTLVVTHILVCVFYRKNSGSIPLFVMRVNYATRDDGEKSPVHVGSPEWLSGLKHCISVQEVPLQSVVRFQAVSQPAVIGSPIGQRTIGPALTLLGFKKVQAK